MKPLRLPDYATLRDGIDLGEEVGDWFPHGELGMQARWYAGSFGCEFPCVGGGAVKIIDFGEWNREPGPDFSGTTVQTETGELLRGDIELDLDVRDWERHGHATNPDFDRTVLHVCHTCGAAEFFTRTREHRLVRQVVLPESPDIDNHRAGGTLRFSLADSLERASELLSAAARFRLVRKGEALVRSASAVGPDVAWFRALAVSLGYKSNKLPFLLLAERCGQSRIIQPDGESLLFGLAGFLDAAEPTGCPPDTRDYLRGLWHGWWPQRGGCERLVLEADRWKLGGIRPANHPHRRVGALAALARNWAAVAQVFRDRDPDAFVSAVTAIQHPYWNFHFNLRAGRLSREQALIGSERARDMLCNVLYPAINPGLDDVWDRVRREKGSPVTRFHQELGERYFSDLAMEDSFFRSLIHQQGLYQLDADFRAAADPLRFAERITRRSDSSRAL